MTKNLFIFKKDNKDQWQYIRQRLEANVLRICIEGNEDFQVEIKPYSKRSANALAAYWCLIKAVTDWDKDSNGLSKDVWHEWFKREAGLIEEVDLMPMWEMRYKKELVGGYAEYEMDDNDGHDGFWLLLDDSVDNGDDCLKGGIYLGKERYIQKTRSISNKGDVTKEEMERLIFCILDFGKPENNNIPNCEIIKDDLDKLLKFCDK